MVTSERPKLGNPKRDSERLQWQLHMVNRLAKENSPYLLQHATNPVDWYPWSEEALRKARDENKPIFLSIGYSSCHWCHVMEKESFVDLETAQLLNANFISIKVDREERPELDEIYMKAVMSLTGSGGWPMSVFLTPELKPFYGGTYFPPVERPGLPSFRRVLMALADLWQNKPDDAKRSAEEVSQALIEMTRRSETKQLKGELSVFPLSACYASLERAFDPVYGGFGGAPKFPMPGYLLFLLRYYARTGKERVLEIITKSLRSMALGGIFDQVGGGFHRYSTDSRWLVPHFEKMLYDNALLARVYIEAFQATKDEFHAKTAEKTLSWMLREMRDPNGRGFYSAQDADSPEGEGAYYVWTNEELIENLSEEEVAVVTLQYGITAEGNFEGKNILEVVKSDEDVAKQLGKSTKGIQDLLQSSCEKLLASRSRRNRPLIDDKILTSWNGLAISAFAQAYQVFDKPEYLTAARSTAEFVLQTLFDEGKQRLLRRYRNNEAGIDGSLEDYAFFTQGLIDLYESTFEELWLETAIQLTDLALELFQDKENGGLCSAPKGRNDLIVKVIDGNDGVIPSGNSVMAMNLARLSKITSKPRYREFSEGILRSFWSEIETQPNQYSFMVQTIESLQSQDEIVIVSPEASSKEAHSMLRLVRENYRPNKIVLGIWGSPEQKIFELAPMLKGKTVVRNSATAYVCKNYVCKPPITDIDALAKMLSTVDKTA